jgi:hypothetical protein
VFHPALRIQPRWIHENWDAIYAAIDLFRDVAVTVGERPGYAYPDVLHQRVLSYLRDVQAMR